MQTNALGIDLRGAPQQGSMAFARTAQLLVLAVSCCHCPCFPLRLVSTKTVFAPASVRSLVLTLYDVVLATPTDLEVQVRAGGGGLGF